MRVTVDPEVGSVAKTRRKCLTLVESLISFCSRLDDNVIRADIIGLHSFVVTVTCPTSGKDDAVMRPVHLLVTICVALIKHKFTSQ